MARQKEGQQELSIRLTHKYVADSSHLDKWQDIGTFNVLSSNWTDTEGEYYTVIIHLTTETEERVNKDQIKKAIMDSFDKGCSCEHDCCGCMFGGARDAIELSNHFNNKLKREWVVKATYSRNY